MFELLNELHRIARTARSPRDGGRSIATNSGSIGCNATRIDDVRSCEVKSFCSLTKFQQMTFVTCEQTHRCFVRTITSPLRQNTCEHIVQVVGFDSRFFRI